MKKEELTVVGLTKAEIQWIMSSMNDDDDYHFYHKMTKQIVAKLKDVVAGPTSSYYLKLKP